MNSLLNYKIATFSIDYFVIITLQRHYLLHLCFSFYLAISDNQAALIHFQFFIMLPKIKNSASYLLRDISRWALPPLRNY